MIRAFLLSYCVSSLLSIATPLLAQETEKQLNFNDAFYQGSQFLYTHQDSASYYFTKAYDLATKEKNTSGQLSVLNYMLFANGYHYNLKNYQKNLERYESIVRNKKVMDSLEYKEYYEEEFMLYQANYFFKLKDFIRAKDAFLKLQNRLSNLSPDDLDTERLENLASTQAFLATIYKNEGKYQVAKEYYENLLQFYIGHQDELSHWQDTYHNTTRLLSEVYLLLGNKEKAEKLLLNVITYYEKNNDASTKNALVTSYFKLTENAITNNKKVLAKETLKKAQQHLLPDSPFTNQFDLLQGDVYLLSEDYVAAEKQYLLALQNIKIYRETERHPDIAEVYIKLGTLFQKQNNPEEALQYFQKALISNSLDFIKEDFANNPDPNSVFSKKQLLTILKAKLAEAVKQFNKNNSKKNSKVVSTVSKQIIATIDALKPEFESKVDRQFLIKDTYPAFDTMLEAIYMAYTTSGDKKYIQDAFEVMEKGKGIQLLESVRSAKASLFGNVPEDIISEEHQYRAQIAHLEKQQFKAKGERIESLSDQIFSLKQEYYNFLRFIENNYPEYYRLKYNYQVASLTEVQDFLDADETFINYHITDTNVYAIVVSSHGIHFFELPFPEEKQELVTSLFRALSFYDVNNTKKIRELSQQVYESVVSPCLSDHMGDRLTIVPHGMLSYVPFGALQRSNDKNDVLLREMSIRYANSATLLLDYEGQKNHKKNMMLAFAPDFGDENSDRIAEERADFYPLLYNKKETQLVTYHFDGKVLTGEDASITNFLAEKDQYSLLHFATHASANDAYPDYSYLAFAPDTVASNLLYVKDLYNTRINADMVTLSACQTGFGALQKGEGMLSLAQGFQYAGAKSLTTTLWKINDQTSAELMDAFYKYLKQGLPKDKALQKAKLAYLDQTSDELLKHPYYWSGFIFTGDNSPIVHTSYPWWLWVIIILVMIVLLLLLRKYQSRSSSS